MLAREEEHEMLDSDEREARAEADAGRGASAEGPPTIVTPARTGLERLHEDGAFLALQRFVEQSRRHVEKNGLSWDRLLMVRTFCRAARYARDGAPLQDEAPPEAADEPLLARFDGAQERRAIALLLLSLLPSEWTTRTTLGGDGRRSPRRPVLQPLPASVLARADDGFSLMPGDVPRIAPVFTEHLRGRALLDAVFRPEQTGLFLVSRAHCPGAHGKERPGGDAILVALDEPATHEGKKSFRVHLPAAAPFRVTDAGEVVRAGEPAGRVDVMLGSDGAPLTSRGEPRPIVVPYEHLVAWLLSVGPGARELDLEDADDRALLLTATALLRARTHVGRGGAERSLFSWLEEATYDTPRADLEAVREEVKRACFDAVALHACDPRAAAAPLRVDEAELARARMALAETDPAERARAEAELDWQARAAVLLEDSGVARAALARVDDAGDGRSLLELSWLQALLSPGFAAGRLHPCAQGDAFARLASTLLAPIGVLPCSGLREGRGALLLRTFSLPDDEGVVHVGVPGRVSPWEGCFDLPATMCIGLPKAALGPGGIDVGGLPGDVRRAKIHDIAALQDKLLDLALRLEDGRAEGL